MSLHLLQLRRTAESNQKDTDTEGTWFQESDTETSYALRQIRCNREVCGGNNNEAESSSIIPQDDEDESE